MAGPIIGGARHFGLDRPSPCSRELEAKAGMSLAYNLGEKDSELSRFFEATSPTARDS